MRRLISDDSYKGYNKREVAVLLEACRILGRAMLQVPLERLLYRGMAYRTLLLHIHETGIETCTRCDGTGKDDRWAETDICDDCGGTGSARPWEAS